MLPASEEMQSYADDLKAKADSLPDGHAEKAWLLRRAQETSRSAWICRIREFDLAVDKIRPHGDFWLFELPNGHRIVGELEDVHHAAKALEEQLWARPMSRP
jgi:hypothetical protein